MEKKFKIQADNFRQLIDSNIGCIASDMITVDGKEVHYMYREEPGTKYDSGWRFFSGEESQGYMDNAENFSFYKINTIANYDPLIIDYLHAPVGTAFERKKGEAAFFLVDDIESS